MIGLQDEKSLHMGEAKFTAIHVALRGATWIAVNLVSPHCILMKAKIMCWKLALVYIKGKRRVCSSIGKKAYVLLYV